MSKVPKGKGCTIRLEGGVFYVLFRHPARKKVVRKSLKTDQKKVADRYKRALDELISKPEDWNDPDPKRYPARVREVWGGKTITLVSNNNNKLIDVSVPLATVPGIDPAKLEDPSFYETAEDRQGALVAGLVLQLQSLGEEIVRLRQSEANLLAAIEEQKATIESFATERDELIRERNHWKGKKLSKAECGTLEQEKKKYLDTFKKRKLDPEYIKDVDLAIARFVREFGAEKNLAEVDEHEVSDWIQTYRKTDGTPITERRRKFIRTSVLKFLSMASHRSFDREAVAKVSSHSIRRENKEIVWLERMDAERLVKSMYALHGDYWGDAARIQLDLGWRPEELLMLRTDLANQRTVTLDVVEGDAPKTGKRSLQVPKSTLDAVRRRISAGSPVLFPRTGLKEKARRPKLPRSGPLHGVMWYPRSFDKVYLDLLRQAGDAVGIPKKRIGCRILRRTFGSLQLRQGKREHEVAALMGDLVETVRRHYARILAEEVSTELSPWETPKDGAKPPARPDLESSAG